MKVKSALDIWAFFRTPCIFQHPASQTHIASASRTAASVPCSSRKSHHSEESFVTICYRLRIGRPIATWSRHPWYWRWWVYFAPASAATPRAHVFSTSLTGYLYNKRICPGCIRVSSSRELVSENLDETAESVEEVLRKSTDWRTGTTRSRFLRKSVGNTTTVVLRYLGANKHKT